MNQHQTECARLGLAERTRYSVHQRGAGYVVLRTVDGELMSTHAWRRHAEEHSWELELWHVRAAISTRTAS